MKIARGNVVFVSFGIGKNCGILVKKNNTSPVSIKYLGFFAALKLLTSQ
jgi:hypothetical protein